MELKVKDRALYANGEKVLCLKRKRYTRVMLEKMIERGDAITKEELARIVYGMREDHSIRFKDRMINNTVNLVYRVRHKLKRACPEYDWMPLVAPNQGWRII